MTTEMIDRSGNNSFASDLASWPLNPSDVIGFLDPDEGEALYRAALSCGRQGPILEVGSYCGKSAVFLGEAARRTETVLFAVDHHRGSEENQPGWEHHDERFWDPNIGAMETLIAFRDTIRRAQLEGIVMPIVAPSKRLAEVWQIPLSLVFIDGGHGRDPAYGDYRGWAPWVMPGGLLAIHDVFPDPKEGGRPPFEIYEMALASGLFEEVRAIKSLRILRRST